MLGKQYFYIMKNFPESNWVFINAVKLGDKESFDKEQIGVKEPFLVNNSQFTIIIRIRNIWH